MVDSYRTLASAAEARVKVERSDFLAIAFPVADEPRFFDQMERIEKQWFDATHHCWAFRLFHGARSRSSDAGEPSGSAGKPILGTIESAGLHDVGLVVVRWFGGVKLGTGGLARAYREAAAEALRAAPVVERFVYARIRVEVPFDALSVAYRLVDPPAILLSGEHFGETYAFDFDVRLSRLEDFQARLTSARLSWRSIQG